MEMDLLISAISTVGFPIVAYAISIYALKYAYDKSREDNNKAIEQIGELTEAVNHNTEVLVTLVAKMEVK